MAQAYRLTRLMAAMDTFGDNSQTFAMQNVRDTPDVRRRQNVANY